MSEPLTAEEIAEVRRDAARHGGDTFAQRRRFFGALPRLLDEVERSRERLADGVHPLSRWDADDPYQEVICVPSVPNGAVYAELKRVNGNTLIRIEVPACHITSLRVYGKP